MVYTKIVVFIPISVYANLKQSRSIMKYSVNLKNKQSAKQQQQMCLYTQKPAMIYVFT